MRLTHSKYKRWTLREWTCCGNLWQLLLSKKFPKRRKWKPICPTCGKSGGEMLKCKTCGKETNVRFYGECEDCAEFTSTEPMVTNWNCETCGKVISELPCPYCGGPDSVPKT